MKIVNITNPNIENQYSRLNNKSNSANQQSFTGVSQAYDKFCNKFGEKVCRPVFNNKVINKIGYWMRNSENAVKHFLAVGSIITSGMYMHQTYTNKKMDKDRRATLTVNQGFTLLLSTLGAYTLDGSLKSWWKKQHERYLRLNAAGNSAWDGMNEMNSDMNKQTIEKVAKGETKLEMTIKDDKALNKLVKKFIKSDVVLDKNSKMGIFAEKLADAGIKVANPEDKNALIQKCKSIIATGSAEMKEKIANAVKTENIVRKNFIEINDYLDKYGEQHVVDKSMLKRLKIRSKGFAALRSILVFGFVYRFFVPLAVVKPTNLLCDKYLEYKKRSKEQTSVA